MLTTTLRSSTYLVLGLILLTSATGCSGCQQQTTVESTSTEDAAKDSSETSNSDAASTETPVEDTEKPNATEKTEPAKKDPEMNARTASNSSQKVGETQAARNEGENDSPSPPASAAAMTASQALTQAEELYTSARSGNQGPGEAFQNASKAWELLNQHPDNAECQAMAAEISKSLGTMATKANQKYRTELSGDPVLIEK